MLRTIIGLPGTGKSTCCKSLLSELCYAYPIVNVFSGSEGDNPFYSGTIPKLFLQNKITLRGLKMFVNRQNLAINYDCPLKDALLILDDCFETPRRAGSIVALVPPAAVGQQYHAHTFQAGQAPTRIDMGRSNHTAIGPSPPGAVCGHSMSSI